MTAIDGHTADRAEEALPTGYLDTAHPLETRFGDPDDPDNPVGFAAFLRADERGELLPAGRSLLDTYQLGAEFVPAAHGGRLRQADELAQTLRPVFRRDAALGLGHGAIKLIASATVWSTASTDHQRWLAQVLLRGGQAAGAYTELASGHDLTRSTVRATRDGTQYRLTGSKEVINNVNRADSVTLLARTGDGSGSRDHSLLLLDMSTVRRDRLRFLPRFRTAGLRAVHLGGVEFLDCPVPASAVVGELGGALETVLRAFQVTKATLTAATVGCFDTQLRMVTRFALERRLYHRSVAELPHVRSVLANAYADLLISDCLSSTVCRALHVLPGQTAVYAPATKYLVPLLIQESVDQLATVLGARSFLREGPYGIFQKHLRDLPVASLAHSGATVCQATVIPQLPRLARRSWLSGQQPAPASLFRLGAPLPELDFRRLEIAAGAEDSLLAVLPDAAAELRADPELGPLSARLVTELAALKASCTALAPRNRTPLAEPIGFELAERYSILLAASACLGVWRHNQDHPNPFLRDTAWLALALRRLTARLGLPVPPGSATAEQRVFTELVTRERENRSFDLAGRLLA
ncbi:acyl-CoA dehydrogenase [Kitasatospora sp. MAP5-34]|uniref:acyl-CoA dehydrogenase n=1 Tax=Kitasatospora sp. MAP5-34 TaxID=3035102 RepID=UPI002474D2D2|nr:acyl-CoA dehydrogenase [Kitasatospora sp. MAP5-34]MDH6580233.1 alkylation response protein AidB-like acyl-CoA dehydrogenase [Kitasatospora sp. MAP5-34]